MRLPKLHRRHILCAALATAIPVPVIVATETVARADFWGGDIPLLIGILAEAVSTVSNLVNMYSTLKSQLAAMKTMLSKLDPKSLEAILSLLQNAQLSYAELTRDINSIGYTLQSVNLEYGTVYRSSYTGTSFDNFDSMYGRWNDEVLAAAQVAARSQTTISTMQDNADKAASILNDSQGADGIVAQLQEVVRMLALISSQNNTLIHSLSTTGRVLATQAAGAASEQQLSREKKKRSLDGYLDRGPDVPPMTSLP